MLKLPHAWEEMGPSPGRTAEPPVTMIKNRLIFRQGEDHTETKTGCVVYYFATAGLTVFAQKD
jgi:hypothetical protein